MRVDSGNSRVSPPSAPARPEPKPAAETSNTTAAKEPLQVKDGFETPKAGPTGVATTAAPAKAPTPDELSKLGAMAASTCWISPTAR